ncbi:conserved hypothetical protein [Thermocrinis albus DSM 14484]|uniref:DNA helicase n=1 Tax=Thermocrinis albus (strain DSM 14484 / JCM 11386 / HI 11/12) TaxID=638303 RepID=D3SMI1_THEAH|nr:cory-CC-star protein [Thermocrinis albus]ADC89961.1 conserved hypothetical protein [Thermocrinis albus DSM 14484]
MKDLVHQFILLHFKKPVEASYRHLGDALLLTVFMEYFGLDNPLGVYALDLYPLLVEEFHLWHRSLGMEKSPFSFIPCC